MQRTGSPVLASFKQPAALVANGYTFEAMKKDSQSYLGV